MSKQLSSKNARSVQIFIKAVAVNNSICIAVTPSLSLATVNAAKNHLFRLKTRINQ